MAQATNSVDRLRNTIDLLPNSFVEMAESIIRDRNVADADRMLALFDEYNNSIQDILNEYGIATNQEQNIDLVRLTQDLGNIWDDVANALITAWRNESPEYRERINRLRPIVARICDNRIATLRYREWQIIDEARID